MSLLIPEKPFKIFAISESERIICTFISIDVWNAEKTKIKNIPVPLKYIFDAVIIDNSILVITGIEEEKDKEVRKLLWIDVQTNTILKSIDSFSKRINSLIFDTRSKCILAFSFDKTVYKYNAYDYTLVKLTHLDVCLDNLIIIQPLNAVFGINAYTTNEHRAFNLDDFTEIVFSSEIQNVVDFNEKYNYVVSYSQNGRTLCIYDLKNQCVIDEIQFDTQVHQVTFSNNYEVMFVALIYDNAYFYDAKTFTLISQFNHGNNPINTEYEDLFWAVTFCKTNKSVIIGCHSREFYEKYILE